MSIVDTVTQTINDGGWLAVLVIVVLARYRGWWVDKPTYERCEERALKAETRNEVYLQKLEEQVRKSAENTQLLAELYLDERKHQ